MPTTAGAIAEKLGLRTQGPVQWGRRIPCTNGGVSIICAPSPVAERGFDMAAIDEWIARTPRLPLSGIGHADVTSLRICREKRKSWFADEVILYAGKARSLRNRIGQYFRTPLGARGPHRGGYWLKALANLDSLDIYWVEGEDSGMLEKRALECFASGACPAGGGVPACATSPVLPLANLEVQGGMRRKHAITHACQDRARRGCTWWIAQSRATVAGRAARSARARLVARQDDRLGGGPVS